MSHGKEVVVDEQVIAPAGRVRQAERRATGQSLPRDGTGGCPLLVVPRPASVGGLAPHASNLPRPGEPLGQRVVSAPFDDTGSLNSGAAYLFDGATGTLLRTFLNSTPADGDNFGWSVTGAGGNIFAGDVFADPAGAAYLFCPSQVCPLGDGGSAELADLATPIAEKPQAFRTGAWLVKGAIAAGAATAVALGGAGWPPCEGAGRLAGRGASISPDIDTSPASF